MDRKEYNECMSRALKGKEFTPEERKSAFCISAKLCTGKAGNQEEAARMCAESAAQPKERKTRRRRAAAGGGSGGGVRLVLITTTGCKPCAAAKQYLQPQIERGDIEVLDLQKDDWAADLCAKAKIVSVPKLLVIDSENQPFSELQITDSEQMV